MVFDLKYGPDTTSVTINKYYKTVTIEEDGETNDPGYITSPTVSTVSSLFV